MSIILILVNSELARENFKKNLNYLKICNKENYKKCINNSTILFMFSHSIFILLFMIKITESHIFIKTELNVGL